MRKEWGVEYDTGDGTRGIDEGWQWHPATRGLEIGGLFDPDYSSFRYPITRFVVREISEWEAA